MIEIEQVFELIIFFKKFTADHVTAVVDFCKEDALVKLALQYDEYNRREVDCGFNLFNLISDTYYKENFHSDILKSLLDPTEKHREENLFLNLFFVFINNCGAKVNKNNYSNAKVYREQGKIDILIKDETTKKSIIIENKIYDAADMPRQLPRYYLKLVEDGYDVDSIIYLLLRKEQKPNMIDWTDEERKLIKDKLIVVNAYKERDNDLLNGWIYKCEKSTNNIDALFVLRQYGKLIQKLGGDIMNMPIMELFYEKMLEDSNFKTASSLKSLLEDLPSYRTERIVSKFKDNPAPFDHVHVWSGHNIAVFENITQNNYRFAIDILVEFDKYSFTFFERTFDKEGDSPESPALNLLKQVGLNEGLQSEDSRLKKVFLFPSQEKELYDYIEYFMKTLVRWSQSVRQVL